MFAAASGVGFSLFGLPFMACVCKSLFFIPCFSYAGAPGSTWALNAESIVSYKGSVSMDVLVAYFLPSSVARVLEPGWL